MANNPSETERRFSTAADEFRAELKSSENATPLLGLIFLRYADHKFTIAENDVVGFRGLRYVCQNVSRT